MNTRSDLMIYCCDLSQTAVQLVKDHPEYKRGRCHSWVCDVTQDSWDSARKITCDWQSKLEKMVTFAPFPVADLQGVAEIKFAGSGDNVKTRMEIQFGRGPFAAPLEGLTKIGDELSVVVYVQDGGAGYDILVKNCYAYDSKNFKNANSFCTFMYFW